MFNELWSNAFAWSNEHHLIGALNILSAEKWKEGVQAILKSYTTDLIINSVSDQAQNTIAARILEIRRSSAADTVKIIDEAISKSTINFYTLYNLFALPEDSAERTARLVEIKALVPKVIETLSSSQHGYFKFSTLYPEFTSRLTAVG